MPLLRRRTILPSNKLRNRRAFCRVPPAGRVALRLRRCDRVSVGLTMSFPWGEHMAFRGSRSPLAFDPPEFLYPSEVRA